MNDSVNDYLNYKIILCYQRNVANFINPNTFVIQNIPRSFLRLVSQLTIHSTYEANQATKLLILYEGEYP